LKLYY